MDGTIRKASDLIIAVVELQFLAKKYFADGSHDHTFMVTLAASLNQLYLLHHSLNRIQHHIDRVHAIQLPDKKVVNQLSCFLENIADTLSRKTDNDSALEAAKAVKQASELLHIWYCLYLNLEQLADVSKELRFAGIQPVGSA